MNPPLRGEDDREAVIQGLADGTIDAIATDHAPHTAAEKARGMLKAPFGVIGFETAFALAVTCLIRPGRLALPDVARLMSNRPRAIIGIPGGVIAAGAPADIALCELDTPYLCKEADIVSKSKNSPLTGRELYGRAVYTLAGGELTYDRQADR
jgi:dihydroorotase